MSHRHRQIVAHWTQLPRCAPWPFRVEQLLDFEGGMTDAVVSAGGETFLLEMLDWGGQRHATRSYRVCAVSADAWQVLARNLRSTSCDLSRTSRELAAFAASATLLRYLVVLNVSDETLLAATALPEDVRVPMAGWRQRLPDPAAPDWLALAGMTRYSGAVAGADSGSAGVGSSSASTSGTVQRPSSA